MPTHPLYRNKFAGLIIEVSQVTDNEWTNGWRWVKVLAPRAAGVRWRSGRFEAGKVTRRQQAGEELLFPTLSLVQLPIIKYPPPASSSFPWTSSSKDLSPDRVVHFPRKPSHLPGSSAVLAYDDKTRSVIGRTDILRRCSSILCWVVGLLITKPHSAGILTASLGSTAWQKQS